MIRSLIAFFHLQFHLVFTGILGETIKNHDDGLRGDTHRREGLEQTSRTDRSDLKSEKRH